MIKHLLLTFLVLIGSFSVGMAQTSDPDDAVLNRASSFAVLAKGNVTNTGETVVVGNLGTVNGVLQDNGRLVVTEQLIQSQVAANAMTDAAAAHAQYLATTNPTTTNSEFPRNVFTPGVHVINGDANLNRAINGTITFDGQGLFFIVVKGSMVYTLPQGGISSLRVTLSNGAEAKNIYWIVEKGVDLAGISLFQGNLIAKESITLRRRVYQTGRVISLNGNVNLNGNLVFLPGIILTDLNIKKEAEGGDYSVGANIKYTITVTNAGPGTATDVVVTENFPRDGLEYVSYTTEKGEFRRDADGGYRWYIGDLQDDEVAVISVTFKLLVAGPVNNEVVIDPNPNNPDPNPDDNTGKDPVVVTCTDPNLTISGDTDFCLPGNEVVYTLTEVIGGKYTYNFSGGLSAVGSVNPASNTVRVLVAGPGKITVSVEDQCGETYTIEEDVTILGTPATPTIEGEAVVCANSLNRTYTVSGVSEGFGVRWVATGDVSIVGATDQRTVTVNIGEEAGTLAVLAISKCLIEGAPAVKQITLIPTPDAPASITGSAVVCAGTTQTYSVAPVSGATDYTWTLPAGWAVVAGTPTDEQEIEVIVGNSGGDITVAANGTCESSAVSAPISITVNDRPAKPAIAGALRACIGEAITLTTAEVTGATNYIWTKPVGWTIVSGGNGTTSITLQAGTEAGTVTLIVENTCGLSEVTEVAVAPIVGPVVPTIAGTTEVCENTQELMYTVANPEEGVTYTWAATGGLSFAGANTGTSVQVNAGATSGTITVTASNNCSRAAVNSQPLQVNVTTPPVILGQITDNSNVCDGLVYTIDQVQNADSYTWTVTPGFTILSGQGTNSIKVKADNATAKFGTVTVTAIDGPCSSVAATATIDASLVDGQLNLPKAFSPNGDGKNDAWEISNLEKFPTNEVIIFNRWGSEVYKKKGYQNDWMGKGLEQGTYFYKVRVTVCDGVVKDFTGYVTLFR